MWPLILSVLVHASLLAVLSLHGGGSGVGIDDPKIKIADKASQENKVKIVIKEAPKDNKSKVVVKKKKKKEAKPKQEYVDHKCDDYYSGIGVQHDGNSCIISYVGKGYPADRAGIMVGDLSLKMPNGECPGRGPLGSHITVKVMRGSTVLTFNMVREKICGTAFVDEKLP